MGVRKLPAEKDESRMNPSETNRIVKDQLIRMSNALNPTPIVARVYLASDPFNNPQSLLVEFGQTVLIRLGDGSTATAPGWPLTVDYDRQTCQDIYGNTWDIDVTAITSEGPQII
jgi:hypothetical protein